MYLLLAISVVFASFNSVLLNRAKISGKKDIIKFNFLCSLVWFVILFSINGFKIRFNREVIIFAVIYGVTQALFILFKTLAMSTGPVSVTTLIGNSSLLISLVVSRIAWNEPIGLFDILGLIVLGVAIYLTNYRKDEKTKANKLWIYYTILFFILAAGVGITFKAFGKYSSLEYSSDMLAMSSIVMMLIYGISYPIAGGFKRNEKKVLDKSAVCKFYVFAIISGILSCVYNRLNVYLTGNLNAIIFFPSFNGGVILFSALLGVLICREKLTKRQIIGILAGAAAICIIGIL